nr:uncharacterized protein LOC109758507 [Aegilops tauschii subsp. strangulata]
MLKGLKLSEEEKKGVKVRLSSREKGKETMLQVVGKAMSERLAHPDAICLSLGKVWCPIKGIWCKEIGVSQFLFTFHQESGKRKAIEDGPWMFDKELVVVEDYVPSKRPEDYNHNNIPIWVRVYNLPLGMMTEESAEDIGNIIGEFVEADTGADGIAIGKFLRIKIRMQIDRPIMRGFTLDGGEESAEVHDKGKVASERGEEEEDRDWCKFEYEYLPDFYYTCGIIGHGEKDCSIKLKKGERSQFGRWLQADIGQRKGWSEERFWRSGGRSSSGPRNYGYSWSGGRSGSGSESLSWRKSDSHSNGGGVGRSGKEEEVTSPVKNDKFLGGRVNPKKLDLEEGAKRLQASPDGQEDVAPAAVRNPSKSEMTSVEKGGRMVTPSGVGEKDKSSGGRKYKKKGRDMAGVVAAREMDTGLGGKRGRVEEEELGKKGKVDEMSWDVVLAIDTLLLAANDKILAGLLEQPRREP